MKKTLIKIPLQQARRKLRMQHYLLYSHAGPLYRPELAFPLKIFPNSFNPFFAFFPPNSHAMCTLFLDFDELINNLVSCWSVAEPSALYDNNHYHEECLRCNSCGLNLTGPNQKRARRFKNHILCDLHFADVALMECSDFMQQLRSFKPQSLGCAVARRKSSTTLIFPLPPQACSGQCLQHIA